MEYRPAPVSQVHLGEDVPTLAKFDTTGSESLLGDRVGVASFLSLVFPRLSELAHTGRYGVAQEWSEVKNLRSYRSDRRRGRGRIGRGRRLLSPSGTSNWQRASRWIDATLAYSSFSLK